MSKLLLNHGANVYAKGADGSTCLYIAIHNRHSVLTKLMLDHGADGHAKDLHLDADILCRGPDFDRLPVLANRRGLERPTSPGPYFRGYWKIA